MQESVAESFKEHLLKAFNAMPGFSGAGVSRSIAQHAYDVVADAKSKGHEFLAGKPEFVGNTSLSPAIVIAPKGARMEDEETFGPSISLYTVKNDEEAIELANNSSYGWSASIHTRDMNKAIKIARQLDYGLVNCNNMTMYSMRTSSKPWLFLLLPADGFSKRTNRWSERNWMGPLKRHVGNSGISSRQELLVQGSLRQAKVAGSWLWREQPSKKIVQQLPHPFVSLELHSIPSHCRGCSRRHF